MKAVAETLVALFLIGSFGASVLAFFVWLVMVIF
jgi:hypothetical protein